MAEDDSTQDYVDVLSAENVKLENKLDDLKDEFVDNDIQSAIKPNVHVHQELAEYKAVINKLKEQNDFLLIENKKLNAMVENKSREITDLEKSNETKTKVADKINKNLREAKEKFDKEKKEIVKNHKIEVKYWRKLLGEETKTKIKLKEELEDQKNSDCDTPKSTSSKTELKKQIVNKKSNNKQSIEENVNSVYSNAIF